MSASQVALRWLLENETVPRIRGPKNGKQAADDAAAFPFSLTPADVEVLCQVLLAWRV